MRSPRHSTLSQTPSSANPSARSSRNCANDQLERESRAELNMTRKIDLVPRDDTELVRIECRVRSVIDRCVERVERFGSELQVIALADQRVFEQRQGPLRP